MTNRTSGHLADCECKWCYKLQLEKITADNEMLREALKVTISNLKWAGRVLQVPATSSYNEDIADAIAALSKGE